MVAILNFRCFCLYDLWCDIILFTFCKKQLQRLNILSPHQPIGHNINHWCSCCCALKPYSEKCNKSLWWAYISVIKIQPLSIAQRGLSWWNIVPYETLQLDKTFLLYVQSGLNHLTSSKTSTLLTFLITYPWYIIVNFSLSLPTKYHLCWKVKKTPPCTNNTGMCCVLQGVQLVNILYNTTD